MSNRRKTAALSVVAFSILLLQGSPGFAVNEIEVRKAFIHEQLLKCYLGKRMLPEAISEYKVVLRYKPNDASLHFNYGNVLLTMGNKPGALSEFNQCVRIAPGVPEYQGAVGAVSMMLKNYAKAVDAYTKALRLGGPYQKQWQEAAQYKAVTDEQIKYKQEMKKQEELEKQNKGNDDD
jgi:stress-induced-phosphoprotein 1